MNNQDTINKFGIYTKLIIFLCLSFFIFKPTDKGYAQSEISWVEPINISNTEGKESREPYLVADPAGIAHLFWAERVLESLARQPDTIFYSQWDGRSWSNPVDIFFSPEGISTAFPTAVIDSQGTIHLVWMMEANFPYFVLYYSYVHSNYAENPGSWSKPAVLADDLTGTNYSLFISFSAPTNLHIVYASGAAGENPERLRGVSYLRSTDLGDSWSEPVEIYATPDLNRGASITRLYAHDPDNLYATWTEWDISGNGQAIIFARSIDGGESWERPIVLTERIGDEYERDWSNLIALGDERLVIFWEGGYRAYRNAMYSYDGGVTWTEPIDTFPFLIGENGTVEYAYDSSGTLHLFVAQRIREGNLERTEEGSLWHSVWLGDTRWEEPEWPGFVIPMINPKVVIINGNQVVAAWYSSTDFEVRVMNGIIYSAPTVKGVRWKNPPVYATETPKPTETIESEELIVTVTPPLTISSDSPNQLNLSVALLLGISPSLLLIVLIILFKNRGNS